MEESPEEREQAELAGSEAAAIGGDAGSVSSDATRDQGAPEEAVPGGAYGDADREQSSEREDEESPSG